MPSRLPLISHLGRDLCVSKAFSMLDVDDYDSARKRLASLTSRPIWEISRKVVGDSGLPGGAALAAHPRHGVLYGLAAGACIGLAIFLGDAGWRPG